MTLHRLLLLPVLAATLVVGLASGRPEPSLLRAAAPYFPVGVGVSDRIPNQAQDWPLLTHHFGVVTPENCMKPAHVQAAESTWDFKLADAFVAFSQQQQLDVVGHCLVWAKDDRTPAWFFRDGERTASAELLLKRMQLHIETVMKRYAGRVRTWDVVNEALDDGTNFLRPSGWLSACGEGFVARAYAIARSADPQARLIYNDYNNELNGKREKLLRLIGNLQAAGVKLDAVGLQGHYELDRVPYEELEATMIALRNTGVKLVVSELDIDVIPRGRWWADGGKYRDEMSTIDPYREGCPADILKRQAEQYGKLFQLFRKHASVIDRVSFWNLHDGQSWLNYFPWKRVNHPLLFDRMGLPKPAFEAVISAMK